MRTIEQLYADLTEARTAFLSALMVACDGVKDPPPPDDKKFWYFHEQFPCSIDEDYTTVETRAGETVVYLCGRDDAEGDRKVARIPANVVNAAIADGSSRLVQEWWNESKRKEAEARAEAQRAVLEKARSAYEAKEREEYARLKAKFEGQS